MFMMQTESPNAEHRKKKEKWVVRQYNTTGGYGQTRCQSTFIRTISNFLNSDIDLKQGF